MATTLQPRRFRARRTLLSRRTLDASLRIQYDRFAEGVFDRHPWRCQKQPCTNSAARSSGSTKSGFPGRSPACLRNRIPIALRADATRRSGPVLRPLTATIALRRSFGVKLSMRRNMALTRWLLVAILYFAYSQIAKCKRARAGATPTQKEQHDGPRDTAPDRESDSAAARRHRHGRRRGRARPRRLRRRQPEHGTRAVSHPARTPHRRRAHRRHPAPAAELRARDDARAGRGDARVQPPRG